MDADRAMHAGGRPEHPVGAGVPGRIVQCFLQRQLVFRDHGARRIPRRARQRFEGQRRRRRSAHFGEVPGELITVTADDLPFPTHLSGLQIAGNVAVVEGVLHHLDDLVPAAFIEGVLQCNVQAVTARAGNIHHLLHAAVVGGVVRQRGKPFRAGQLHAKIGQRLQRQRAIHGARSVECQVGLLGREADRLGPQLVAAGTEMWKHVDPALVRVHRGRKGLLGGAYRHRHAIQRLAGPVLDRADDARRRGRRTALALRRTLRLHRHGGHARHRDGRKYCQV